jgi:hypothetical protein
VGIDVEVVFSSGFGQYRVIRKRLGDTARPLDAVVTEPASVANIDLILMDLRGRTGVVLLNAWDPIVETHCRQWAPGFPIGTISMRHVRFGELQGRQGRPRLLQRRVGQHMVNRTMQRHPARAVDPGNRPIG